MARLKYRFLGGDYGYKILKVRRVPIFIDDCVSMVMEMDPQFLLGDEFQEPTKAELREFSKKFQLLSTDELEKSLKVTEDEFLAILNQMIPCIGCRRSAEQLYQQAAEFQFPVFHPMHVDKEGSLRLIKEKIKCKFLCRLFHCQSPRGKVQMLVDSLAKCKPGRRCALHSIDSQRVRAVSSWVDIWEFMDQKCQAEIVMIESSYLLETLQRYLNKHRFCGECKSKVQRAYQILVQEVDGKNEPGFVPAVYEGIRFFTEISYLRLVCSTDFVSRLIAKAVPEIIGNSRRERHAKTMEIAQEEVLTCIGICLFERLNRVHQRFREEEHTWEILMCAGIQALRRQFEVLLEKKLGVSQLELFCEELNKEEQLKQQKKESKKQRRRRKKEKKAEESTQDENQDPTEKCLEKVPDEEDAHEDDEKSVESQPCEVGTLKSVEGKKRKKKSGKGKIKCNERSLTLATMENEQDLKMLISEPDQPCQTPDCTSETAPDAGYSSENVVYLPSSASSEGSDIACSDGFCNYSNGDCSTSSLTSCQGKGSDFGKDSPSRPRSTSFHYPLPYRSLEEQLEDDYSSDEEEQCIPEEEVCLVQTRLWEEKREEFRKHLLMKFNKMMGVNIPPPFKHVDYCPHSTCKSSFECCVEMDEESVRSTKALLEDGSENKSEAKNQSCRTAGTSKPRAGTGGQASRRYKGKNRR